MLQIKGTPKLGLRVLDFHGGQFTPTYTVGSSFYADRPIDDITLKAAISELRHLWAMRPEGDYDNCSLKRLIRGLELLLNSAEG